MADQDRTADSAAHPLAILVPWGGKTLCKCPHCGSLDVSYLGRDGLDICGTCHGSFICRQEPVNG
jgi:hypothetical protein